MSSDKSLGNVISVDGMNIKLVKILAQGGYGVVFSGVDINTKEKYAVKRLIRTARRDHRNEVIFSKQFANCENIVNFFGSIRAKMDGCEQIFMVNELCTPLVINGPLCDGDVAYIFTSLLKALSVLHSASPPVIHRDIKLENVLISKNGQIKLCDFGSATTNTYDMTDYSTHQISLLEQEISESTTLLYRAPEMVDLYQQQLLGVEQDVWAMGCLLYCLCFFRLPFEAPLAIARVNYKLPPHTFAEVIRAILVQLPRPSVWEISEKCSQLDISTNHIPTFIKINNQDNNNILKRAKDHLDIIGDNLIKQFSVRPKPMSPPSQIITIHITSKIVVLLSSDLNKSTVFQCEKIVLDYKASSGVVFIHFPASFPKQTNMPDIIWNRRNGDSLRSTIVVLSRIYKKLSSSPSIKCIIYGKTSDSSISYFLCALLIYCRLFDFVEDAELFLTSQKMEMKLFPYERGLLNLLSLVIRDSHIFVSRYDWHLSQVNLSLAPTVYKLYCRILVENRPVFPQKESAIPISKSLSLDITVRGHVKLEIFYLSAKQKIVPFFSILINTERLSPEASFHHFTEIHCKFAEKLDNFEKVEVVLKMNPLDGGLSFVDSHWMDLSVSSLFPSVAVNSGNELIEISQNFELSKFAKSLLNIKETEVPEVSPDVSNEDPLLDLGEGDTLRENIHKSEGLFDFPQPFEEIDNKTGVRQSGENFMEFSVNQEEEKTENLDPNVLFDFPGEDLFSQAQPKAGKGQDNFIDLEFDDPFAAFSFPGSESNQPNNFNDNCFLQDPFVLPTNPVEPEKSSDRSSTNFFADAFGANFTPTEQLPRTKESPDIGEKFEGCENSATNQGKKSSGFCNVSSPHAKTMGELKKCAEENQNTATKIVNKWCLGKGKNIRLLLSSLQEVLWEGARWSPIFVGDLMMGEQVKKFYRRAVLIVHPDKVKSAEYEELAILIYNRLSEAWTVFCSRGMKDMI